MTKKDPTRKPTRRDFEAFKKEFLRCIELLALTEWKIYFNFAPLDGSYAEIEWQADMYIVTVSFSSQIHTGLSAKNFDPKRSGRHEAAHLLVAQLVRFGKDRYILPDMFDSEEERIARTLEKIL